tara:strand:- start:365 stop:601 length:237 start_codon:yes stop_codon:yes gene_type:complete
MTNYEVRVEQTHVDYYRIEAKSEDEAKSLIFQHVGYGSNSNEKIEDDYFIKAKKVDTIKRVPTIRYAVQLSPEGEPIL